MSEEGSVPEVCGTSDRAGDKWVSFAAGVDRVYGIWLCNTYHDNYGYFVTRPVASDGKLGPASEEFWDDDSGGDFVEDYFGVFDVRSNVLYAGGALNRISAHAIGTDGALTRLGRTTSCVSRRISGSQLLVAIRGVLFARTWDGYESGRLESVCSYESPRLDPSRDLGFSARCAAGVDPDDGPGRVAFPVRIPATSGLKERYEGSASSPWPPMAARSSRTRW